MCCQKAIDSVLLLKFIPIPDSLKREKGFVNDLILDPIRLHMGKVPSQFWILIGHMTNFVIFWSWSKSINTRLIAIFDCDTKHLLSIAEDSMSMWRELSTNFGISNYFPLCIYILYQHCNHLHIIL